MWAATTLKVGGATTEGYRKGDEFQLFVEVAVGDKIEADGQALVVQSVEDYANRGEYWIVKGAVNESASRRTKSPTGGDAVQGTGDA
jgi:hypothetical protein